MMFTGEGSTRSKRAALLAGASELDLGYGRFMQTDPLGYEDGMNWYAYAGGDPINNIDPTGMTNVDAMTPIGSRIPCQSECAPAGTGLQSWGPFRQAVSDLESIRRYKPELYKKLLAMYEATTPSKHSFTVPTYTDPKTGDIVTTARVEVSDLSRWILVGDRYVINPHYVRPLYDIGIDGFFAIQVGAFATAGSGVVAARLAGSLEGATVGDIVRWGDTVVSNQLITGKGSVGASVRWAVKGGGPPFSWKYHVGSYNWYKPWIWFKQTPILK